MPGRTRIGFIGAGGIAERHAATLQRIPDARIVAFADRDFERAATSAARHGAAAYRSHEDMLQHETFDALYICVPPFAHGEPEMAAVEAGLPFFVEKPVSVDIATAERIAAAVQDRGLVAAVGYHWRYLDTVEEARGLLCGRPVQLASGYWLDQTPPPAWWWREQSSGGQVVEQATHIVDLMRCLVGEIEQVHAFATRAAARPDFPGLDVATATAASLRFASGAVATLGATCMLRWGHRIGLHLFADGLAIELSDRQIMVDVGRGRPVRDAGEDPVFLEDRDFVDVVRGRGGRVRCSYVDALRTHRAACAIATSARTGEAMMLAGGPLP